MGCPSPAALLVHQARQAEYQELPPDIEDDIASLMRAAGAPRSWLDDYLDSSSDASSDSGEASCSYAEPLRLYVASESAVKASVQQQQQVELQHTVGRLICKVQQIDLAEEWGLESIASDFAQRQESLVAEDHYYQDELEQHRKLKLQELHRELSAKEQQNQQAQETIKSQEQERQQQEDQQRRELDARRNQQEEQNRKQLEQQRQIQQQQQHDQHLGQQQQQQQELKQKQAAEALERQQPQQQQQHAQPQSIPTALQQPAAAVQHVADKSPSAVDPSSLLRVSDSATAEEAKYKKALKAAEEDISSYISDESRKKERRDTDKQLLKLVQQISGTQEQVRLKSEGILKLLSQLSGPWLTHAYLQLVRKLLLQCETQIAPNPKSCFPIAEVTAAVATHHPDFAVLLVAKLQESMLLHSLDPAPCTYAEMNLWTASTCGDCICKIFLTLMQKLRHLVCPLTVPKCYIAVKGAQKQYYKLMRFQEGQDAKTGQVVFEKADLYMKRNSGFIAFYAALMQSDRRGNPLGLDSAWKYIARFLNSLPANRATGTALMAFLQTAGYRLYLVYKGQFIKLLKYIFDNFHPQLTQTNDPDAKAIAARLGQYINQHLYQQIPEGQQLPTHDQSTDVGLYT